MVDTWLADAIELSAGRVAYHRTGGERPPLVLLHGLTDNGLCWERTARALASRFDVVMPDAWGHGASSLPGAGLASDPVRDLTEFLEGLGLVQPVVLGHSVGALAAMQFASARSDLLSKLVLEDPPLDFAVDLANPAVALAFRKQIAAFGDLTLDDIVAQGRTRHPTWIESEFLHWAEAKHQIDPGALDSYRVEPWRVLIPQIRVPTLLIRGEAGRDGMVTEEIARETEALNPLVRSVEIGDAGHNVRRENFAAYMAALKAFLDQGRPDAELSGGRVK